MTISTSTHRIPWWRVHTDGAKVRQVGRYPSDSSRLSLLAGLKLLQPFDECLR